ncbi:MAG: phosphodiester glycosidase family protein [Candidatus Limnocylindrales bacterium]
MRLRVALLMCICASWIIVPAHAAAQILQAYSVLESGPVAPGVTHESGTAEASAGTQQVNVLTVAPGASDVHFETSLPMDRVSARESVTAQALRRSSEGQRVIGAVNANLWSTWGDFTTEAIAYSPIGLSIVKGELITSQWGFQPAFGERGDGSRVVGAPFQGVEVTFPDDTTQWIQEVNSRRDPEQMNLYTPRFDTHTWTDALGVEVVLETGGATLTPQGVIEATVVEVRADIGDAPIGPTQFVLSAAGTPAEWLRPLLPGDEVTISTHTAPEWTDVSEAVGGAELLVADGVLQTYSPRRPDAVLKPQPRTAIGIRDDGGIVLVVVDGRSSLSRGVTNAEMGELLISLGVVDAVNLDGGGSTTMAVRRPGDLDVSVANRPSDGVQRTVSTSLQLVSTSLTTEMTKVVISTGSDNVYVDETHQLVAKGHDANFNGIELDQTLAAFSKTGDAATLSSTGLLYAVSVGQIELGLVYGELGEFTTTRTLDIERDGAPPIVSPPTASLAFDAQAGTSTMGVNVAWAATDVAGVVASMQLQRRVDDGSWSGTPLPSPLETSLRRVLTYGRRYQFRVRATDDSGNRSAWTYGPIYRVDNIAIPSVAIPDYGTWVTKATSKAIGGSFSRSDVRIKPQPWAAGAFTGIQAALISVKAPKSGFVQVHYDGSDLGSTSLYRSTKQMRSVVFMTQIADADQPTQQHWLDLRNVSSSSRPFVDLDSLLVLVADLPAI